MLVVGHHQTAWAGQVDLSTACFRSSTSTPATPSAGCSRHASPNSSPHCSNDNPFSESHFKTLKYRPDFPDQFDCLKDGRAFCATFYRWCNQDHRHSGIGMHTPFDVHHGHAGDVRQARAHDLTAAYAATPERFVNKQPEPFPLPGTAWINRPDEQLQPTQ